MVHNYGDHLSDEELVALCKKRLPDDPRPFAVLVRRYQRQVLATCFRMLGDWQEAEDQAQEVFIRVYRGIRHFEGRAKFSTWLFQVAINTCRTALKKRARRPKVDENSLLSLEMALASPTTTEEAAFAQIEIEMVTRAFQTLSEDERIILTLRETDGLSHQEIAQVLDIGLSAAKMRVMRARLAWQHAYQILLGEKK